MRITHDEFNLNNRMFVLEQVYKIRSEGVFGSLIIFTLGKKISKILQVTSFVFPLQVLRI